MKLSELIAKYGDDNVQMQPLDGCIISADYKIKRGTHITFGTDARLCPTKGTEQMGIVVWMDRDKVKEIIGD